MDNMSYIIVICLMVPMIFMLITIKGREAKAIIAFLMIGIFSCMFISEINSLFLKANDSDYAMVTTSITPVTEEIIKAFPILVCAYVFTDDFNRLRSYGFAVGVGFAILENMVILLQNASTVTLGWALVRGFGSALMHGICTSTVGMGISYVHSKRQLFISGTFALLVTVMTYHAIYNVLVQSQYKYLGFVLPGTTFVIVAAIEIKKKGLKGFFRSSRDKAVQNGTSKPSEDTPIT